RPVVRVVRIFADAVGRGAGQDIAEAIIGPTRLFTDGIRSSREAPKVIVGAAGHKGRPADAGDLYYVTIRIIFDLLGNGGRLLDSARGVIVLDHQFPG